MNEKQWQQRVTDYARLMGWLVYHPYDSRRSAPGFPDLTLVRGSRLVFAELKAEKGRLTGAQADWLSHLGSTAAETYVWRPEDWPAVLDLLRMTPVHRQTHDSEDAA